MKLSGLFKVSLVAAAMTLAGCGGDIQITPTVNDNSTNTNNSVNNSNNTTGNTGTAVECTSYETENGKIEGTFDGLDCLYNNSFASSNIQITSNLTFDELPNDGVHVFDDALLFGLDGDTSQGFVIPQNGPTLTVKPGAKLAFKSGDAIIRVARGAKIQAIGTFEKPIIFTSAKAFERLDAEGNGPLYADWGGIIINGNGITNGCTDAERDAATCNRPSEGITSYYGGNDNSDSSGNIKFAKIWYAGSGPKVGGEGDDLNSLTLNAVGAGSLFEYIHVHQGYDDGVELFGGAANLKRIIVTDSQDDSFDFDSGWQGNAQFLFAMHGTVTLPSGTVVHMGNGGFEADGIKGEASEQAPTSNPTIANVTVITTDGFSVRDNDPSIAFKFDDSFTANFYNVLMTKDVATQTSCFNFSSDGERQADKIIFNSSVMSCASEFAGADSFVSGSEPDSLTATTKAAWFDRGGINQRIGEGADVFANNGFATNTASTDITITANDLSELDPSFFEPAPYIGAVSDQDTDSTWYKWVEAAVTAARAD